MKYFFYSQPKKDKVIEVPTSKFARDFAEIEAVLENPPDTWLKYSNTPDGWENILKMELVELHACVDRHGYRGIIENLNHVAAASISAHHLMTCDK